MGSHPVNLFVRFILELSAIFSMGLWGWNQSDHLLKYLWAFILPVITAATWGIFAVPGDPSRSGSAPVAIPGIFRLIIELIVFGSATYFLFDLNHRKLSIIFGSIVVLHYFFSYDRVKWLLKQ